MKCTKTYQRLLFGRHDFFGGIKLLLLISEEVIWYRGKYYMISSLTLVAALAAFTLSKVRIAWAI